MHPDQPTSPERLWTPWRMKYIGGGAKEDGCIFCNRLASTCDSHSLIIWRGQHTFSIMNLFPYNTGHIMIVPNTHAADPAHLDRQVLRELGEQLPTFTNALRRVFGCDGFNIGLNIGPIAGAGIAEHLHQHVVPRWQGDANFMPIIARTMAIPELIPVTYGKIRAEIERDTTGATGATLVLLGEGLRRVLMRDDRLPRIELPGDVPVWKALIDALPQGIGEVELAGWAGASSVAVPDPDGIALAMVGIESAPLSGGWAWTRIESDVLDDDTRRQIDAVRQELSPAS